LAKKCEVKILILATNSTQLEIGGRQWVIRGAINGSILRIPTNDGQG